MKKIAIIVGSILLIIIIGMLCMHGNERNTEVTKERTRVGFIYNGTIDDKGWGQSHYEGISKSAKELNLTITYKENVPFDDSCMTVMKDMIDGGCEIIICNSFNYGDCILKVAKENPEIKFYHATGVRIDKNVSTYFGRIYQMRYLSGIVAGMQTESDSIGYVAAFPISEVNRGINAFTLGVQSVNPNATVHVVYTESWTDYDANSDAAKLLCDEYNVDILTMHCDTVAPLDVAEEKKIWSIGYNMDNSKQYPNSFLTAAVWNWEAYYTPQLLKCLQGKFQAQQYWEGVETGIVSLSPLTSNVKEEIHDVIKEKEQELYQGKFDVFYGPITDSDGNVRIREKENMSDDAMLNRFDWYVKGVHVHEE